MTAPTDQEPLTLDLDMIEALVRERWLNCRAHPDDADLLILNYTTDTQFANHWTPLTRMCRGLIARRVSPTEAVILARPFPKFFAMDQHMALGLPWPAGPFNVREKMDGSLGILYRAPDGLPAVATRGSFNSEQAIWATAFLRAHHVDVPFDLPNVTYLFEIIYAANRVVVDYHDFEGLVLLSVRDTARGVELPNVLDSLTASSSTLGFFPVAPAYTGISTEQELEALVATFADGAAHEGVVLHFPSDETRVKVKSTDYKRLHRLLTGINAHDVWERLRSGEGLQALLERTPDEFYTWLRQTSSDLAGQHRRLRRRCLDTYDLVMASMSMPVPPRLVGKTTLTPKEVESLSHAMRKAATSRFREEYPDIEHELCLLYDHAGEQALSDLIWDRYEPKGGGRTFRLDLDA